MHSLRCLSSNDKAIVIVPLGLLFRSYEKVLREFLVSRNVVEAVIRLPGRLWQRSTVSCALLVLDSANTTGRKGQVLFIDPSPADKSQAAEASLDDHMIKWILNVYDSKDAPKTNLVRVVANDEILAANTSASLDPTAYMRRLHAVDAPGQSTNQMLSDARSLEAKRRARVKERDELLKNKAEDGD